jgi:hypothetical protein
MAHSNSWDETNPTNSTNATSIDDEIRKLRIDARERLAIDHNLTASDAGAATVGFHKQVTFENDLAADPGQAGDVTSFYPKKLATGDIVPFFEDSSTVTRVLLGDANCKVWMYTATAPVGWAATSSPPEDVVLAAVGGATYTTAGAEAGSWTLAGITQAEHNHQWHKWDDGQSTHYSARSWNTSGTEIAMYDSGELAGSEHGLVVDVANEAEISTKVDYFTTNKTPAITHDGTDRLDAAVNKLFQPDTTM